jgi:hypothetical protein
MTHRFPTLALAAMVLVSAPAGVTTAQTTPEPEAKPQKPITQQEPNAVDVIATPVTDLNLKKGEIPPILLAAQTDPYSLYGLRRCADLAAEVSRLDAVLGDDIDIGQAPRKASAGRVAQSVVGAFIPFRGVIRELSGANEQERKQQYAIYAGSARRSFLKGVGQQRGCSWPARSVTAKVLADMAERNAAKDEAKDAGKRNR